MHKVLVKMKFFKIICFFKINNIYVFCFQKLSYKYIIENLNNVLKDEML